MFDVVLYAAIATIVCAMLYSVLGKNVGQDPTQDPNRGPGAGLKSRNAKSGADVIPLEPRSHKVAGVNDIMAADNAFDPAGFTDGAKAAYAMILESFAEGDRATLKNLLSPSVFEVYEAAITDREGRNLKQVTDLARLISADISDAVLSGQTARISVLYKSELSSALVDMEGKTVEGDPDVLSSVSEIWTYERNLRSKDPNWLLADVEASTGDALEADPTPDTKA